MTMQYGWTPGHVVESHGYLAPAILDVVRGLSARRVLDLGCGHGDLTSLMQSAGLEVVGIEPSEDGVTSARTAHPAVQFEQGSAYDDFAATFGQFDAIVSVEVIEHLYSPHLLIRNARKALAPGGHLILTTPYHGYLKNLAISLIGGWDKHFTATQEHMHIKFFSMSTLGTLLDREGFEIVRWEHLGRFPMLAKSMLVVATPKTSQPTLKA